ncbi:GntR family transcriptional regulator [Neobacillus mesonae]|nr:GntR family transcriptional regulator [Neobacillus mesonae]
MNKMADQHQLPQLIKEHIIKKIMSGDLRTGDKLVEMHIAEEFGTSRAPVREALSLLLLDGYIQKFPRKGTIIKGYTLEETEDLLEIRRYLEDLAIQRIRMNKLEPYLTKMNDILEEMDKIKHDPEQYARLNYEFHYQLILSAHSNVIKDAYNRLGVPLLNIQTMSFMEIKNIQKSLNEHKQIVHYLQEGQVDQAIQLLSAHNKDVFPRIQKYVQN